MDIEARYASGVKTFEIGWTKVGAPFYVGGRCNRRVVHCVCGCGREADVSMISNDKLASECCRKCSGKRRAKHGRATARGRRDVTYSCWVSIRNRCKSTSQKNREYYLDRGITVCDRWLDSFENFLADMGERPSAGHSIDRIDVNGNYEPGNCRWATVTQQQRNKRSNVVLKIGDESMTVTEWSTRSGIKAATIFRRIGAGWPAESAVFSKPARHGERVHRVNRYEYNGAMLTINELAAIGCASETVVRSRIRIGWSTDAAVNTPVVHRKSA